MLKNTNFVILAEQMMLVISFSANWWKLCDVALHRQQKLLAESIKATTASAVG
jgi:hypothetical protein